jgi:tetratricopeptide (TPR) repeat protein
MACINPRHIPQSLLPQTTSSKKRTDAIGLLKAFSFVNEEGKSCSLNIHRLVHLATRNWMRKNQLFSQQILKTADRQSEAFPNNYHSNRKLWREYLPHVLSFTEEAEFQKEEEKYVDMVQKTGDCLYSDGRYKEAEDQFLQVLKIRKQVLGPEHPQTLTRMAALALTYWSQGRWKRAEKLAVEVLSIRKRVLGPDHPDTLDSMASLAATYWSQGRWKDAEILMLQVMERSKQVLGPEHPDTLLSMANLASIYWNQGQQKKAEELQVQVTEMQEKLLGPEHPNTLTSMYNLASFWKSQGTTQAASALLEQCLALQKKVLGPSHPDTLSSSRTLRKWTEEDRPLLGDRSLCPGQAESDHPQAVSAAVAVTVPDNEEHIERMK